MNQNQLAAGSPGQPVSSEKSDTVKQKSLLKPLLPDGAFIHYENRIVNR